MLIASSPVEIEAMAEEAGLSQEARDAALRIFHALTDRIGQVTVVLGTPRDEWPSHRFYFSAEDGEVAALLRRLEGRADMADVTDALPGGSEASPGGLYVRETHAPFAGVLVAHEDHEGYRSDV